MLNLPTITTSHATTVFTRRSTLPHFITALLFCGSCALAGDPAAPAAPPAERLLEREIIVAAPLADLWHAWTTADGIASFFAPESNVELRRGGPYELYIVPSASEGRRGCEGCQVLSYIPQQMLSFTWNAPPVAPELREAGERTTVVLRFDPLDDGRVRVRLTQLGFAPGAAGDTCYAYFEKAWTNVLANLKRTLEANAAQTDAARHTAAPTAAQHYVYFVHPAREGFLQEATADEERAVREHAAYIKALTDKGTVVLAGPSWDPPVYPLEDGTMVRLDMPAPGIVIFEADSEQEARRIMEGDPAVRAGVFKARLNPFHLAFQRTEPRVSAATAR